MSRIGVLVNGTGGEGDGDSLSPPTVRIVTADAATQAGDLGNVVMHTGVTEQVHTLNHANAIAYTVVNGTDQPLVVEPTGGRTINGGASYALPPAVGVTRPGLMLVYNPGTTDWVVMATVGLRADLVTITDESGEFVTELFGLLQIALDTGSTDDAVEDDVVFGGTLSGSPKMMPISSLGALLGGASGLLSDWTVEDTAANLGSFLLPGKRYTAPGSNEVDFARLTIARTGFVDGETTVVWGQHWDWEAAWDVEGGDPEPFPTNNTHLTITQIAGVTGLAINGALIWPVPWEMTVQVVPPGEPVTTGDAKCTFRMPRHVELYPGAAGLRLSCDVGSSSGDVVADLNHNGSSMLTDKLTIDSGGARTSLSSSSPVVIADVQQLDNAEMTVDVDSAGTGCVGLFLVMRGFRL